MTSTEALEKIRNHILNGDYGDGTLAPILNWCDEALESPKTSEDNMKKRNCDVGTAQEQSIRFDEFCQECEKCPLNEKRLNIRLVQCEFLWAQMPYEPEAEKKGGVE